MRALARVALAAALLTLAASAATAAERGLADARSARIADRVMRALGGEPAWDALRGLRWTFGSSVGDTIRATRRHAWDKHTGWHRVEGVNRAGQRFVFIHRVGTGEGRAWMDGTPIEGDSLVKLLQRAQSLWVNDTYWMLMPYKLRDPGVRLEYAGERREGGATYDELSMTFDQVGETPGDHYWVWVDRADHRIKRWSMVLQGDQPPARTYTWEGWEAHGGLWFPTAHRQGAVNVFTRDIETVREFRPTEFTAP